MPPKALIFSDPNCPYCYATEERLFAAGLTERVDWCGVQHAPELAIPMQPAMGALLAELPAEVDAIRSRAPEIAIAVPPGKPNTRAAIEYAAAALRLEPVLGRGFVRSLYRAFWVDGTDISDPAELGTLAERAGFDHLGADDRATSRANEWQAHWQDSGMAGVPLLVHADGRALYGLKSAAELSGFLD